MTIITRESSNSPFYYIKYNSQHQILILNTDLNLKYSSFGISETLYYI